MIDKAPDAYRTISEVGEDLGLPQHVLRFWETRFSQIRPLKRGGGRRYYRPDDVELLKGIRHLLYAEGYTIKGVQRILKEQGPKAVQAFAGSDEGAVAGAHHAAPQDIEEDVTDEVYEEAEEEVVQTAPAPSRAPFPPVAPQARAPESAPIQPHMQAKAPVEPQGSDLFAAAPPQPAPAPIAAPAMTLGPTVSFTRGGLSRAQTPIATGPAPEQPMPILPIRKRPIPMVEETPVAVPAAPVAAEPQAAVPVADAGLSDSSRRALQAALVELTECRRAIDRVTAGIARSANP